MASSGFPPGLVLYQEQGITKPLKDLIPLLPTTGPRHDVLRSGVLRRLGVQDDFGGSGSELYGYSQFSDSLSLRRLHLPADLQDMHGDPILFSFGIDKQWTKRQEIWQFLMSRSDELKEDNLFQSFVPDMRGLQALPADMYLKDVTSVNYQLNDCVEAQESCLDVHRNSYTQDIDNDLVYNVPCPRIFVHLDGRISLVGTETDTKDLASVLAEFAVTKESAQWTKQRVLVPHFRWNDALDLQDVQSSTMLGTVTSSPLKSPERNKRKSISKRKTKKAARERDLYRNNSIHAFETILSLMVDKKRNGKSMMNSLNKSGPEVPQLLTQVSASITGTGIAVMFSVLYKVVCGSVPFSTSNVLTSVVGVGLFWLSWAMNRLRDTIVHISKNFSKIGFDEGEMLMRVDKSVNNIVFRAAAVMALLMLRFA